jgi:hypothetical protein
MGPGYNSFQEGNRLSLLGTKHQSSDEWKMGNQFGSLGRSRVYDDFSGWAPVTMKGPSKWGMNLATRPDLACIYLQHQCNVDNRTLSPTEKISSMPQCLLAKSACVILAVSRLSCASWTSSVIRLIMVRAEFRSGLVIKGSEVSAGRRGGMIQGDRPMRNWKGEKPVEVLIVFIRLKWTSGSA